MTSDELLALLRRVVRRVGHDLWRLITATVASCLRWRVTGLAAEAAFFAVLSVPPLVFALTGAIGFFVREFTAVQMREIRSDVIDLASQAMTESTVNAVIAPTFDIVTKGGRLDVISIGFVLALWSGSRALNVFVDTITIMHGLGGERGIIRTRVLSFGLYILGLLTGMVTIPLVIAGPSLVRRWIPDRLDFLESLYWPTVLLLCVCFLTTLYHVSVPSRSAWRYHLPGAFFTIVCWIGGSWLLRTVLTATAGESTSVYGPLSAPITVLIWLYIVSIAVLIGAAVNASVDVVWPHLTNRSVRD
ncbi:YihY/virulence factor BrkB family protein [Nocardioides jejuensis]|uniref:YihY/virulence factor BrkB family protein n=1 Tax=Nocardioides jejuensis TaxID=2502782 RepID=A0A4R1CCR0_9ACTN|nr:YihY/virulence factor BrkB family protein [Nocardioides jejuensis]TCJ28963.1 YihY/virulence factor BrkB family protein [Nocardioides jejuensis]